MYKCEILADSMNPQGDRITTFRLTYPRIIHAELMTHRMFSRNSASSRAIPFEKMVKMVEENPFIPIAWQKDHKGMQGTKYFNKEYETNLLEDNWLEARNNAVEEAVNLNKIGLTKQLCNRLLEPFMWHTVLITATEFENFFELRCPQYSISELIDGDDRVFKSKKDLLKELDYDPIFPDSDLDWLKINKSQAEIHIQAIAEMMWDAMNESIPKTLQSGEWHIPFGDNMDINLLKDEVVKHWNRTDKNRVLAHASRHEYVREEELKYYQIRQKIATARCARISYETLGDNPKIDYEADIKLHDKLIGPPFHASPFEHCARAMSNEEYRTFIRGKCEVNPISEEVISPVLNEGWCNNFKGFIQYRYLIENK